MRAIIGTVLAIGLGASACVPGLSMNERVAQRDPQGEFSTKGIACYALEDGSSSGSGVAGGNGDFSQSTVAENGVLRVEIRSGQAVLAMRRYDRAFARSGVVDEFIVVTNAGDEFRFRYWGSRDCE